jgi:hypothetical protein
MGRKRETGSSDFKAKAALEALEKNQQYRASGKIPGASEPDTAVEKAGCTKYEETV